MTVSTESYGKTPASSPAPKSPETLPRRRPEGQYTLVDLFSGAGGMTCGFYDNGFRILGAVDKQLGKPGEAVPCNDTYEMNFGVRPDVFDLAVLDGERYRSESVRIPQGDLTVLISCPPCTGYSQKRFRNASEDDARNALVARTADFVDAFRPEFLVMENVPEMITGGFAHHFRKLNERLSVDLGYNVWFGIVDFLKFGLPQHRRRALVVARKDGKEVPDLTARFVSHRRTVREAFWEAGLPATNLPQNLDPTHVSARVGGREKRVIDRCKLIRDKGGGRWVGLPWESLTEEEIELLTPRVRAALEAGDRKTYPDCYGTIRPDAPSPTLVRQCGDIGTGPWFHWHEDRMLTAREMAVLQGFPYHPTSYASAPFYRFAGSVSRVYQQIGNAIPPLVSGIVAEEVLRLLEGKSRGVQMKDVVVPTIGRRARKEQLRLDV